MTYLWIGIIVFAGAHLFSMLLPKQRDGFKAQWGEKRWKGAFALASLAGVVLMVIGLVSVANASEAQIVLYVPGAGARHIAMTLVLLGFIALAAMHGKGYIRKWLRNPMSAGIALWAVGHLAANGMLHELLFFGTFLVVAVLDILLSELRGKRPQHVPEVRSDVIAVVAGVALYVVFLFVIHPYVFRVPVLT